MQDCVPCVCLTLLSFVLCIYKSTQVDSVWMSCLLCQHDCRFCSLWLHFLNYFFGVLLLGRWCSPEVAGRSAGIMLLFLDLSRKRSAMSFLFFTSSQAEWEVYVRMCASKLLYEDDCNQGPWFAHSLPFASLTRKSMYVLCNVNSLCQGPPSPLIL